MVKLKILTTSNVNLNIENNPIINLNTIDVSNAKTKYKISSKQTNILLGIGGSGETKRIPAKTFISFMDFCSEIYDCRFFLATGNQKQELDKRPDLNLE